MQIIIVLFLMFEMCVFFFVLDCVYGHADGDMIFKYMDVSTRRHELRPFCCLVLVLTVFVFLQSKPQDE